jgi:transcriptional regulator with XRE-family HTH domain
MTAIDETPADLLREDIRKVDLQEEVILDFTCNVIDAMKYECMTKKQVARKLGIKKKKLKAILNGECKISLRQASDLYWAVNRELKIGVKLPETGSPIDNDDIYRGDDAEMESVTIFIDDDPKEIERGERTVAEILDKVGKNPDGYILFEEREGPPMQLPMDRPVKVCGCEVFRTQVQGGGSS